MSAQQHWKAMILAEHAQSERMRATLAEEPPATRDHWQPYANMFQADPHRTDDAILNRLRQEIQQHHTVIDVGAGGGRMALPLALCCRQVVAVEPSPSMGEVLLKQTAEYSINNVSLVSATWEDAQVEPADLALCCNVLYTVQEIGYFLRKLEAHAGEQVLVVMYNAPPQSQLYPLWEEIHGEERLALPSLPQFEQVLAEMGVDAKIDYLPPRDGYGFDSLEQAVQQLSRRLYLPEASDKQAKLVEILTQRLEEIQGKLRVRGDVPLVPALISWQPR